VARRAPASSDHAAIRCGRPQAFSFTRSVFEEPQIMTRKQKTGFTMDKIALELNLSKTAISYALSPNWMALRISRETRDRVMEFVNRVGYRRNNIAVSLRTKKTKTIGTLLPILGPDEHELLSSITDVLDGEYTPFIGASNYSPSRELQILHSFEQHMVDGLIVSTTKSPETRKYLQNIIESGTPVVQFGSYSPRLKSSIVEADNQQLGQLCTTHLIEMGYSRIAFLRSPRVHSGTLNRAKGYEKAMKEAGLPPVFFPVEPLDQGDVGSYYDEQSSRVLTQMTPPFGIVTNEFTRVLRVMAQFPLRCPEDVGLVGIDADTLSHHENIYRVDPTLVVIPLQELGMQTATELLRQIESEGKQGYSHIKIPGRLLVGKSTRRISG